MNGIKEEFSWSWNQEKWMGEEGFEGEAWSNEIRTNLGKINFFSRLRENRGWA